MGNAILGALFPNVGNALRLADNDIVMRALQAASGINFQGLQQHVVASAGGAIYRAIGRQEVATRANSSVLDDPVLSGTFGVIGR